MEPLSDQRERIGQQLAAFRARAERAEAERDTLAQAVAFVINWHDLDLPTRAKLMVAMDALASDQKENS